MLTSYTTSRPGLGEQPTLTQGSDFSCSGQVCFGNGAQSASLMTLQGYINKFANAIGFGSIAVDGQIGPATVTAFRKVVAFVLAKAGPGSTMNFGGQPASTLGAPEMAQFALQIIETLDFWTGALSNPSQSTANVTDTVSPSTPITSTPNSGTASMNLPNAFSTSTPSGGSFGPGSGLSPGDAAAIAAMTNVAPASSGVPWWAWVAGGAVLLGGVTAVVVTRRRRKAS